MLTENNKDNFKCYSYEGLPFVQNPVPPSLKSDLSNLLFLHSKKFLTQSVYLVTAQLVLTAIWISAS